MFTGKYKIIVNLLFIVIFSSINVNVVYAKTFKVCVLKSQNIEPYNIALKGFTDVLREKGYIERKNLAISYYNLGQEAEGVELIEKVKNEQPDLILTIGTKATREIKKEIKTIPVVFSMVLFPVENDLIASIQCSGNNLTGASMDISPEVWFEFLKETLPQAKKIGVVYNPNNTGDVIRRAMDAADKMKLDLIKVAITSSKELPDAIKKIIYRVNVLWVIADNTVIGGKALDYILPVAFKSGVPIMGQGDYIAESGGLFSLNCDYNDVGRQSGEVTCEILNGIRPEDLPISVPKEIHLTINVKVAENLGLNISPSILKKADRILE